MTLSPADRANVLEQVAAGLRAELAADGGLDDVLILPVSVVAQLLGITRQHVGRILPLTRNGTRTIGVTRSNLRDYVAQNTEQPRKRHDQDGTPPRNPRL